MIFASHSSGIGSIDHSSQQIEKYNAGESYHPIAYLHKLIMPQGIELRNTVFAARFEAID